MGWMAYSQILPMFLQKWFIFWLGWPGENIVAGWHSPWEDDVLTSFCSEIPLDLRHRINKKKTPNPNKINSSYHEGNPLLWKMHKIRDSLHCWCACPCALVSVECLWAQQLWSVWSLGPAAVLEKSSLAMWGEDRSHQDHMSSLYIHFPHPQDGINSTGTHIRGTAVLCSLQGADIPDLPQTNKSPRALK